MQFEVQRFKRIEGKDGLLEALPVNWQPLNVEWGYWEGEGKDQRRVFFVWGERDISEPEYVTEKLDYSHIENRIREVIIEREAREREQRTRDLLGHHHRAYINT